MDTSKLQTCETCETIPTKTQLVTFLRSVATDLEESNLSSDDILLSSEFYMKYYFLRNINTSDTIDDNLSELVKYLSLGYHIYTNILPNTQIDEDN